MAESSTGNLILRAARPDEAARVLHIFRDKTLPGGSQVVVATRLSPVERILGAIAGWTEGQFARFHLACLPGTSRDDVARQLINQAAQNARQGGIRTLMSGEALKDDDPLSAILRTNRFEVFRSERYFRVDTQLAGRRIIEILEKFGRFIPGSWRVEPIRKHPPEAVLDLIAPYRLLRTEEVRQRWPGKSDAGFDPEMSVILFDGNTAVGTLLVQRRGEHAYYDVRVVRLPDDRQRSLANLSMFKANMEWNNRRAHPVRWLEFRGGESEHRETANLAKRMGGTELPPRHVWARSTEGTA